MSHQYVAARPTPWFDSVPGRDPGLDLVEAPYPSASRAEPDNALLVARRRDDQPVITKLDRLGWSLQHLIDL